MTEILCQKIVQLVDPYTSEGKLLPVAQKIREVLCHKHWSDSNSSVHPRDVQACSGWGCNQQFGLLSLWSMKAVIRLLLPEIRMGSEQLSMQFPSPTTGQLIVGPDLLFETWSQSGSVYKGAIWNKDLQGAPIPRLSPDRTDTGIGSYF